MIRKLCGEVGVIPPAAELVRSKWYSHYMLDWMNHFLSHRDEIIIDRYIHETGIGIDDCKRPFCFYIGFNL